MSRTKKEVDAIVSAMGVFMAIISNLVEFVKKLGGSMENIYRLATPEGSETLETIARIIVDGVNEVRNKFLKLISSGESLVLNAVDGKETLADAKDLFAYIDPDFKNWGANKKGLATKETFVNVYEMKKNATFSQMFGSLSADVGKLYLTQHQIKKFVKKHLVWLRTEGYSTFFLFKSNDNFFVAEVIFNSDGKLLVVVYRFEVDYVCSAGSRPRVVVPQLA